MQASLRLSGGEAEGARVCLVRGACYGQGGTAHPSWAQLVLGGQCSELVADRGGGQPRSGSGQLCSAEGIRLQHCAGLRRHRALGCKCAGARGSNTTRRGGWPGWLVRLAAASHRPGDDGWPPTNPLNPVSAAPSQHRTIALFHLHIFDESPVGVNFPPHHSPDIGRTGGF